MIRSIIRVMLSLSLCMIIANFDDSAIAEIKISGSYKIGLNHGVSYYARGAWGDMDKNGWLDLVVAGGADVAAEPDAIYFNFESGIESTPSWISLYHSGSALLELLDLDANGYLDIVVPNFGLPPAYSADNQFIYYNDSGSVELNPSWISTPMSTWGMAAADIDGDGDIDIAFPCYNLTIPGTVKVFYNSGGIFDTLPNWESDNVEYAWDAAFADIDLNGFMDLCITGDNGGVKVFYNTGGALETSPSWTTSAIDGGTALDFGDIDGDGYPDLAVAGAYGGDLTIFKNQSGTLESVPSYQNASLGQPSCVAWADVDADGDMDLGVTFWTPHKAGVLENIDGYLTDTLVWSVTRTRNVLDISWGDFDNDNVIDTIISVSATGISGLITLGWKPLHSLTSVRVDGQLLDNSQYCYDLKEGWISLASVPEPGTPVEISYSYSGDLDASVATSAIFIYENLIYVPWEDRDPDGDEIINSLDNCPDHYNPLQEDMDADNVGDSCDNCMEYYNPEQEDLNENGIGDICEYICGDANRDDSPNVGDAVFIISFVFKGGPAPIPIESGDANCDGNCNVGDAVYIIGYVFKGGPDPCAWCE